eukprot:gb/GEZN01002401.1/.p1 GENE.gb/GEZN01002401.1/~~gb/GEZN01002401.1/.p1  ORF type:complete len:749 (+),score=88.01 gb/GEZN01002401.1/:231-2249(+)
MLGGTYSSCSNDDECNLGLTNLVDLLENKGLSWKGYMENYEASDDGDCNTVETNGFYYRKHNPFMSFTSIKEDPDRCAKIVDENGFISDVQNNNLPNFGFFSPNADNDSHNMNLDYSGAYLQNFLETYVYAYPEVWKDTLLFVTFDEDDKHNNEDNHLVGFFPAVNDLIQAGKDDGKNEYTHYSITRLIEDNFSLGSLGTNDAKATTITLLGASSFTNVNTQPAKEGVWKTMPPALVVMSSAGILIGSACCGFMSMFLLKTLCTTCAWSKGSSRTSSFASISHEALLSQDEEERGEPGLRSSNARTTTGDAVWTSLAQAISQAEHVENLEEGSFQRDSAASSDIKKSNSSKSQSSKKRVKNVDKHRERESVGDKSWRQRITEQYSDPQTRRIDWLAAICCWPKRPPVCNIQTQPAFEATVAGLEEPTITDYRNLVELLSAYLDAHKAEIMSLRSTVNQQQAQIGGAVSVITRTREEFKEDHTQRLQTQEAIHRLLATQHDQLTNLQEQFTRRAEYTQNELAGQQEFMVKEMKALTNNVKEYTSQQIQLMDDQHREEMATLARQSHDDLQDQHLTVLRTVTEKMSEVFQGQQLQIEQISAKQDAQTIQLESHAVELSRQAEELKSKLSINRGFILRTMSVASLENKKRFWRGEKMIIDRHEQGPAQELEDWRF